MSKSNKPYIYSQFGLSKSVACPTNGIPGGPGSVVHKATARR